MKLQHPIAYNSNKWKNFLSPQFLTPIPIFALPSSTYSIELQKKMQFFFIAILSIDGMQHLLRLLDEGTPAYQVSSSSRDAEI